MRFAYADPPYVGMAAEFYGREEVDHVALIERLVREYPDGWVLSCHTPSARDLWPMTPPDTRLGAWFKPVVTFKKGVAVTYSWEPVLFRGGRKRSGETNRTRDSLYAPRRQGAGLRGSKPEKFCEWVLNLLGYEDGDTLDDLFPGTGIMGAIAAQGRVAV